MIKISVSIDVSDLKKAEVFYIEALDCKKSERSRWWHGCIKSR